MFKKYNSIENSYQGKYIKLILDDAKEDFNKDYDLSQFDAKDQKTIYNVGNLVVQLLKKQL